MSQTINVSIYVPRMNSYWSKDMINDIMVKNGIGSVAFVDFTPIGKKSGFKENPITDKKAAFIHFQGYYYGEMNNTQFWKDIQEGKSHKLQISSIEYWICLKNKNPIQRTCMNIHQVVENGRYLENLVQEQATKIEVLEKKLDNIQEVVYQLLGGLYCQSNQSDILRFRIAMLHGEQPNNDICDNGKWGIWPTTRQGDECERRIEALENLLFRNLDNEDQDTHLLNRKYNRIEIGDDSTIESELMGEHICMNEYDCCPP